MIFLLIIGRSVFSIELVPYLQTDWFRTAIGSVFAMLALLIVFLNIWLRWLDPWLYQRKYGKSDYHGVSPLPVVSGFFCGAAAVILPASLLIGLGLLLLFAIDPVGLPAMLYLAYRLKRTLGTLSA